ncbi:MAG: PAS domain S-box protein [Gemmatimonadota bacterium]|nr:PAS domain S-box protein [Gemmatimonadota bacterium]
MSASEIDPLKPSGPTEDAEIAPSLRLPDHHPRIALDPGCEGVWLLGADGGVHSVSPLAAFLLGYAPEELTAASLMDRIHPDDQEAFGEFLRSAWGGKSQGLAPRVRRKDGDYIWLGSTARPVRGESGDVVHLQVVSRDVTERKRNEETLRWLSHQNRLILNSVGDGICGLDARGHITFRNPAAEKILGFEAEELVGKSHHEAFYHSHEDGTPRSAELSPIHATLREGTVQHVREDVFWRTDGTSIPVEYISTPALDEGAIVGSVLTFRDITERKRNETNLRRAEWLAGIGQTVLTLRHEINNPLTSMLADAALLEMAGNSAADKREMIASIIRQARRISDVVALLGERKDDPALRQVGSAQMLDLTGALSNNDVLLEEGEG